MPEKNTWAYEMTSFSELSHSIDSTSSDAFSAELIKFLKTTISSPSEDNIRASGLPLCGRSYSFNKVLPKEDLPRETTDFLLGLQGETGTVTHRVVQKWLGMTGILLGNWKCNSCGKVEKWHLGSPKCKKCKLPMSYEELSYQHPTIKITGHPDGILVINGEHVGFELKTKNQEVVDEIKEPIDTHVSYQTACYAALLKLIYGIELKEYVIFYLSRDSSWSYKVGYSKGRGKKTRIIYSRGKDPQHYLLKIFRFKVDNSLVEKEFSYIKSVIKAQKKAGNKLLPRKKWGLCKDVGDTEYCPHRFICFSSLASKME